MSDPEIIEEQEADEDETDVAEESLFDMDEMEPEE